MHEYTMERYHQEFYLLVRVLTNVNFYEKN